MGKYVKRHLENMKAQFRAKYFVKTVEIKDDSRKPTKGKGRGKPYTPKPKYKSFVVKKY